MLIIIKGDLVVERLTVRNSFALLSVPAGIEKGITFLDLVPSTRPKANKATYEAKSSADVEAH